MIDETENTKKNQQRNNNVNFTMEFLKEVSPSCERKYLN